MRLDKLLSNTGIGSRSAIRKLIRSGEVQADGETIKDPAYAIANAELVQIEVSGHLIQTRQYLHIMLHKPAGLITALDDKKHATIADLLPEHYLSKKITPVGRLDIDTTGLLILTNDGILCHRLANPRWAIAKTYAVTVTGDPFTTEDQLYFKRGIKISDDFICRPASLTILADNSALLTIQEGKFHQVKRMMRATGRTVTSLHRLSMGPLTLDQSLEPGNYRFLTDDEISALYKAVDLDENQDQTAAFDKK